MLGGERVFTNRQRGDAGREIREGGIDEGSAW
jgi:hypothetical protein